MELKEGHWKAKGCNIDYILTNDLRQPQTYSLYCIQTKEYHYLSMDKCKNFIENHMFLCELEDIYLKAFKQSDK